MDKTLKYLKAAEQYFTVVPFVFKCHPVCNYEKVINFGLGTVRSEMVNDTYPFAVLNVGPREHSVEESFLQLFVVVAIRVLETLISHIKFFWKFRRGKFGSDVGFVGGSLGLSSAPYVLEIIVRSLFLGKLVAFAQRDNNNDVVTVCKTA